MISMSKQKQRVANNWRYNDVKKRKIAKKNNLNFVECWEKQYEGQLLVIDPIKFWLNNK